MRDTAGQQYVERVLPFRANVNLRQATNEGFDPDLVVKKFVKADRPRLASLALRNLDAEGAAALKYQALREALEKATARRDFSASVFSREIDRMQRTFGKMFTKEEFAEINGLAKLARSLKRAEQFAENPPTGINTFNAVVLGGSGALLATGQLETLAQIAAPIGGISLLLTTKAGRRILVRHNSLNPRSREAMKNLGRAAKELRRIVERGAARAATPNESQQQASP